MDSYPVTANSAGRFLGTKGSKLERSYKDSLSDYRGWEQKGHADEWVLFPNNMGTHLSIDETQLHNEVYTIVSNKAGHGKKGTVIAIIKGTKAEAVLKILLMIMAASREKVVEITMDFSDSMRVIAGNAFPKAEIVVDCFHVMQRCGDSIEEIRLKEKRQAIADAKRQMREYIAAVSVHSSRRKRYRAKHPKKYKGKTRGRKPQYVKRKFTPERFSNGDTRVELLARSRNLLTKSRDKWTDSQKKRAKILFNEYPKIKEAYELVNKLRCVFKDKKLDKAQAKKKFKEWYKSVAQSTLREVKAARDLIKSREDEILNYFNNRSTNAAAESLNAKMKGFRSQMRGISDLPFFMYRLGVLFG